MEYAKPVLAATDKATDIKALIQDAKCGEWVWSGDEKAFTNNIKQMTNAEDLIIKGFYGRNYVEENYHVGRSVALLED